MFVVVKPFAHEMFHPPTTRATEAALRSTPAISLWPAMHAPCGPVMSTKICKRSGRLGTALTTKVRTGEVCERTMVEEDWGTALWSTGWGVPVTPVTVKLAGSPLDGVLLELPPAASANAGPRQHRSPCDEEPL